jgi:hypothetical protein
MGEYVVLGAVIFISSEYGFSGLETPLRLVMGAMMLMVALSYAVWRERIDVKGLVRAALSRFRR